MSSAPHRTQPQQTKKESQVTLRQRVDQLMQHADWQACAETYPELTRLLFSPHARIGKMSRVLCPVAVTVSGKTVHVTGKGGTDVLTAEEITGSFGLALLRRAILLQSRGVIAA